MTNEEMKSELTKTLETWSASLAREEKHTSEYTTFKARIAGRIEGMIDFAYVAKIINDAEKSELYYVYFGEDY